MQDTLENLYFGNITPSDQTVRAGSALKKAMEQSAECEEKLTILLEDKEKRCCSGSSTRRTRSAAPWRWKTSSWGFTSGCG